MATRMQQRRGTAEQWTTSNPILNVGEIGFESDNNKFKIGDGENHWADLPYFLDEDSIAASAGAYLEDSLLGAPNGVAQLNSSGKLVSEQIPNVDEITQDAINTALVAGTGLDKTYNDNANTITIDIDSTVATKTYADGVAGTAQAAAELTASGALSTHSSVTTSVHGIADTAELATKTFAAELLTNATKTNIAITGDKNGLTITAENGVADSNTDNLTEGSTNKYFTDERAQDAVGNAVGTGLTYTDSTGAISVTPNTYDAYGSAAAITASTIGLGNVDNTSDANKPVSTATQTALDLKAPIASPTFTGSVTLPGAPTSDLHAVTKLYVDNVAAGINFHEAVHAASVNNLAVIYNNGTSGVGATLTADTNRAFTQIDGESVVVGQRVLIKNQTDAKQNGIYVLTTNGSVSAPWVLTRATDADNNPSGEMKTGDFCFVTNGTTNASVGFVNSSTANPIVIGTDSITYTEFNAAKTIVAGNGLTEATPGVLSIDTSITQARVANVSDTEIGYLDGVTSPIQTQLDTKIAKADISAKGAILVGTGSGTYTSQTVGTNGQVLTANSAQADGVEWTTISGYSAPTLGSTSIASGATVSTVAGLTLTSPILTSSAGGAIEGSGSISWPDGQYPAGNLYGVKTVNGQKRLVMPNIANFQNMPIGSYVSFFDTYCNNGVCSTPVTQYLTTTGLYDGTGFDIVGYFGDTPTDTVTASGYDHQFGINWSGTEPAQTITADNLRSLSTSAANSVHHKLNLISNGSAYPLINKTLNSPTIAGTGIKIPQESTIAVSGSGGRPYGASSSQFDPNPGQTYGFRGSDGKFIHSDIANFKNMPIGSNIMIITADKNAYSTQFSMLQTTTTSLYDGEGFFVSSYSSNSVQSGYWRVFDFYWDGLKPRPEVTLTSDNLKNIKNPVYKNLKIFNDTTHSLGQNNWTVPEGVSSIKLTLTGPGGNAGNVSVGVSLPGTGSSANYNFDGTPKYKTWFKSSTGALCAMPGNDGDPVETTYERNTSATVAGSDITGGYNATASAGVSQAKRYLSNSPGAGAGALKGIGIGAGYISFNIVQPSPNGTIVYNDDLSQQVEAAGYPGESGEEKVFYLDVTPGETIPLFIGYSGYGPNGAFYEGYGRPGQVMIEY